MNTALPWAFETYFPGGSAGKESTCNAGDLGLIPGLGRSPGEGKGYPLQYSGLENSMNHTVSHKESDTTERLSHRSQKDLVFALREDSWWKKLKFKIKQT